MAYTAIEPSLQVSIVTILGYLGFIVALVVGLGEIGIDPQKIALVAGALSVGIGFGLQSIVSNFVSGLILLAERPIRVGDQIVVKNEEGFVRRISVRATEIETFDKGSVIVPNSELITGVVKNWTHANTLGRVNIKVSVSYACDPERVMEILNACVGAHPGVLKQPPPAIQLSEFGASAMMFDIFCIVPNLADRGRNGLGAVTLDPQLMKLAEEKSRAMVSRDKLDHNAGKAFQQRINGYDAKVAVENVSAGYHPPAEAFSGWRDSPPHRANMLKA